MFPGRCGRRNFVNLCVVVWPLSTGWVAGGVGLLVQILDGGRGLSALVCARWCCVVLRGFGGVVGVGDKPSAY